MIAAVCGGVRVVSIYAPNGRTVGSIFYQAKLAWFRRLQQWLGRRASPSEPLVVGGDYNVAPEDADVWDPARCHGGTRSATPPPGRGHDRRLVPLQRHGGVVKIDLRKGSRGLRPSRSATRAAWSSVSRSPRSAARSG